MKEPIYRNIKEIPHITRSEFAIDSSYILERIGSESLAYIVMEKEKPSLLICPVSWFSIGADIDFGAIVGYAIKYTIGRSTYLPDVVMSFASKYLHMIDSNSLENIARDIRTRLVENPDLNYSNEWNDFQNRLGEEIEHRHGK